ncbi:hypothetical protein L3X40_07095 [Rhizorhapis sp. SPR117]|nr:hypothetical protein [Rhizorhapis sp. SPR117]
MAQAAARPHVRTHAMLVDDALTPLTAAAPVQVTTVNRVARANNEIELTDEFGATITKVLNEDAAG